MGTLEELLRDDNDDEEEDAKRANKFDLYEKLQKLRIDAPNLLYMIDHVNRLSLWVATEILSRSTTAEMADLTKYFYHVANHCLNLQNVHTCTAIFGGICLQPLTRLRKLNRYLTDDIQIQVMHKRLTELVCSDANYRAYRGFMEQWYLDTVDGQPVRKKRPCIPFIPVLVKDLFNIQFGLVKKVKIKDDIDQPDLDSNQEQKLLDLGLLEKNCRQI